MLSGEEGRARVSEAGSGHGGSSPTLEGVKHILVPAGDAERPAR